MVCADTSKELQNVLPKCNPFVREIDYHTYRVYVRVCRWQTLPPTHLNNFIGTKSVLGIAAAAAATAAIKLGSDTDDCDDIDDISDISCSPFGANR